MAPSSKRKRKQIYEGKAKILFEGPDPGTLIQYFKDDATAFNNKKKGTIAGKGIINNLISELVMTRLGEIGVPTHFIKTLNMREQLVRSVQIIPLEVIVRNVAAGSLSKRLGIDEGLVLPKPLVEFCYKKDELNDPFIAEEHISIFGWLEPLEIEELKQYALRINDFLYGLFAGVNIRLIDFKIEFGKLPGDEDEYPKIILADEISPDSCRLWDMNTNEKLDKDRFRQELGNVAQSYQEVARRLGIFIGQDGLTEKKEPKTKKATTKKPKTKSKK